jgi:hypothetical protein
LTSKRERKRKRKRKKGKEAKMKGQKRKERSPPFHPSIKRRHIRQTQREKVPTRRDRFDDATTVSESQTR